MGTASQRPLVRLMIYKMARDNSVGGFGAALAFLSSTEKIRDEAIAAKKWCTEAIAAVRNASDPNPWREATDDEIAAEIMRQLDAKEVRP